MAEYGQIGKGQTLGIAAVGESPTYTLLAKVRDISGPGSKVDSIESTHSTSTAVEKIPGFLDNGDVTANLVYAPAQTTVVRSHLRSRRMFEWTMSDGAKYHFTGFVTALGKTSPYKDLITQDMTIAISGEVTFTEPT